MPEESRTRVSRHPRGAGRAALIEEFERIPEAGHSEDAEVRVDGTRAIALAEDRPRDAIAAFKEFDDGNGCATCAAPWLGRAWDLAGNVDSARVEYENFVTLRSADLWYDDAHLLHAWLRLGEMNEAAGDTARAVDSFRHQPEVPGNASIASGPCPTVPFGCAKAPTVVVQ